MSKDKDITRIAGVCLQCRRFFIFVNDVNDAPQRVASTEYTILLGNFNAHIGTGNGIWNSVTDRHGDPATDKTADINSSFVVATDSAV